ncbi:MAG: glycosyltransferase family 2 protein [Methanobacteriaceae archaeon]|nr:glycosyltransferase family 2 protein [Methanobacteriaceae archaeon]
MVLSIIIVNFRTFELTKNTIDSVLSNDCNYDYEILVVDNKSDDGSLEKLEETFSNEIKNSKITFIANNSNMGFSYANNLAIKKSSSKYILLLNSDTIIKENTLNKCLNYIETHQDVGALGCKVSLPNGELDKACKRSFPNPINSFYRLFHIPNKNLEVNNYNLSNLDDNGVYEIDCLVGAFMLVKKDVINQIGMLDEDYFMYGEDIDWCYRIKESGWKIIYFGEVEIVHYKGSSSNKKSFKLIYEFHKSMYIFYKKHLAEKYFVLLNFIVYVGIAVHLIVKLFINIFK